MTAVTDVFDEYIARYSNWGRWGAGDEVATGNYITADHVREAARLVRTGQVISLAMNFDQTGPQTGANGRFNCLRYSVATGSDHVVGAQQWAGKPLPRKMGYADDTVVLHLQSATHWDSLAHIFHDGHAYNGVPAALLSSQGAPRRGDAPGLSFFTIPWLAEKQIAAVASDTWGVEVRPNELPDSFQPFHIPALVYMGLLLGEMFDLEPLAAACADDGVYEAFVSAPPLPFTGTAGAPPGPVATR
jgi:kynurenine formamidase